jgi:hypothetical protein
MLDAVKGVSPERIKELKARIGKNFTPKGK